MRQITFILILLSLSIVGCKPSQKTSASSSSFSSSDVSRTTGWKLRDMQVFGFDDPKYINQEIGPGLRFVEGGTFTMGRIDEDVMKDWDNVPRRITIHSFYMDETEVTNFDYRQYLAWLRSVYPEDQSKYISALPDTLVWREPLGYNEPFVSNYLRHPAYNFYPVVGVSWRQANDYCKWRTDRVNEFLLIKNGYLAIDSTERDQNVFTTEAYLTGAYQGLPGQNTQSIRWENGLLLPNYRLPTEAEWEYAALGLIGEADGELLTQRRIYPWTGQYVRDENRSGKGEMKANFTRGRGDLMGMAGALNDAADISADVFSFAPNDYGLYCMAGNVNEWVGDVYRPLSSNDVAEFQPFRGNVITEPRKDANGKMQFDKFGQPIVDTIADYRNYGDGDYKSNLIQGNTWNDNKPANGAKNSNTTTNMYIQGTDKGVINSFITDEIRVYKGGSWKDRIYWMNPGSRRYLDENEAQCDLGFRCAMTHLGPPTTK